MRILWRRCWRRSSGGRTLVVYDDVGGVIGEPGVNFENGVQTPSLMAIYELAARGW